MVFLGRRLVPIHSNMSCVLPTRQQATVCMQIYISVEIVSFMFVTKYRKPNLSRKITQIEIS